MASDRYYKIWIHKPSNNTWLEAKNFVGLKFSEGINAPPKMSVTLFLRSDATAVHPLIPLLIVNANYRITNLASTDGTTSTTGARIIQEGYLSEPNNDEKSAVNTLVGKFSAVWDIKGQGYAEKVQKMVFDNRVADTVNGGFVSAPLTGTSKSIIAAIVNNVITNAGSGILAFDTTNSDDGIVNGTTGIVFKPRQDHVYDTIIDLARLGTESSQRFTSGDGISQYMYFVRVVPSNPATGVFTPKIIFLKPNNSVFSLPNGRAGYRISDPTTDPLRTIDELSGARAFDSYNEVGRIANKVAIRYSGLGSTAAGMSSSSNAGQQTLTLDVNSFLTSTMSLTLASQLANSTLAFGQRMASLYAPYIQDSYSAEMFGLTVLDMYKGTTKGLERAEVLLREGALYSSTFDATLGDVMCVRRRDGTFLTGRMVSYAYDQDVSALGMCIGYPPLGENAFTSNSTRKVQQQLNAMERTTFVGQSTAIPTQQAPSNVVFSAHSNNPHLTMGSSATFASKTLSGSDITTNSSGSASKYFYVITLAFDGVDNPRVDSDLSHVTNVLYGPFNMKLTFTTSGGYSTVVNMGNTPEIYFSGISDEYSVATPFTFTGSTSSDSFSSVQLTLTRSSGSGLPLSLPSSVSGTGPPYSQGTIRFTVTAKATDAPSFSLSHVHNM